MTGAAGLLARDPCFFDGLVAVVQYRRKDGVTWWAMAAFDSKDVADKYAAKCSDNDDDWPWEYRVVELEREAT